MLEAARSFGYRNLVYLAFVAALFPLAPLLDVPVDPEDGGGLGLALSIWAAVSIAFFLTTTPSWRSSPPRVGGRCAPRQSLALCRCCASSPGQIAVAL
jgi:hypothetical protein